MYEHGSTTPRRVGRPPLPKVPFTCTWCGTDFKVSPARARLTGGIVKFCGLSCRRAHDRVRAIDPADIERRYWEKVIKSDDPDACWGWARATDPFGYGHFAYGPKGSPRWVRAHIFSYELHIGPVPQGKCVLHKCDNPPCNNPRHLWIGTRKDNTHDMIAKGRQKFQGLRPGRKGMAGTPGVHHWNATLTDEQIRAIRLRAANGTERYADIGQDYGISRSHVGRIVRRDVWKHVD